MLNVISCRMLEAKTELQIGAPVHNVFEAIADPKKTLVKIRERGWDKDDEGILRLADQTQGWVNMIFCLKGYLEYGINLRTIAKREESQ